MCSQTAALHDCMRVRGRTASRDTTTCTVVPSVPQPTSSVDSNSDGNNGGAKGNTAMVRASERSSEDCTRYDAAPPRITTNRTSTETDSVRRQEQAERHNKASECVPSVRSRIESDKLSNSFALSRNGRSTYSLIHARRQSTAETVPADEPFDNPHTASDGQIDSCYLCRSETVDGGRTLNRYSNDASANGFRNGNGDDSDSSSTSSSDGGMLEYVPASLIAFLVGGILYLVLAIWDLALPLDDYDPENIWHGSRRLHDTENADSVGSLSVHRDLSELGDIFPPLYDWDWYSIVAIAAPGMYVVNFIIETYEMLFCPESVVRIAHSPGQSLAVPIGLFGIASIADLGGAILDVATDLRYEDSLYEDDFSDSLDEGGNTTASFVKSENLTLATDGVSSEPPDELSTTLDSILAFLAEYEILAAIAVHFYLFQAIVSVRATYKRQGYMDYEHPSNPSLLIVSHGDPSTMTSSSAATVGRLPADHRHGQRWEREEDTHRTSDREVPADTFNDSDHPEDSSDLSVLTTGRRRDGSLYLVGDSLFLIGCAIDLIIGYLDVDGMEESHQRIMQWFGLLSAAMWLADAICYTLAGIAEYRREVYGAATEIDAEDSNSGAVVDQLSLVEQRVPTELNGCQCNDGTSEDAPTDQHDSFGVVAT